MRVAVLVTCLATVVGFGCGGDDGGSRKDQIEHSWCEVAIPNDAANYSQRLLTEYQQVTGLDMVQAFNALMEACD